MNTFWLKIAGLAVMVVGIIILVSVLSPSEPQVEGVPNPKVDYVAKINELGKAGRDETLNAAPFYQKAIDLYVERGQELKTTLSRRPRLVWTEPFWTDELSDKEQSLLRQWVQSNSEALSQLELGTKKPYYWLRRSSKDGIVWEISLPELNEFRKLSRAITWHAKLNAAQGNNDKAMKDIVTYYHFGLHQMGPKTLVEQLMGIAIRTLAVRTAFIILDRTEMSQASMKSLQRQIEQLSTDKSYIPDMRAEKFMMLDIIQRVFTDDGKGDGRISTSAEILSMISDLLEPTLTQEEIQSFPELQRRQTTEAIKKLYEYFDFVGQKTPWQWKNEQINPDKGIEKITEGNTFVQKFCPAFVRAAQIFARCRAQTDALITTLALLRYKTDKGQLPDKLDELVSAGYLKALSADPCSGRPFVYKRIGGDFMLYSFGTDCDDDGGTHNRRWDKDDQVFWPIEPGLKKSL